MFLTCRHFPFFFFELTLDFSGVCLTDLTFIEEGNKDFVEINGKKLINFRKRELASDVILEIQLYQQVAYSFEPDFQLISLLNQIPHNDDEKLYELSLLREPRNADKADIT